MKKRQVKIDHTQCECMIRQRGPHHGLYCIPHNHWIKWLNDRDLQIVKQMDIPMIVESTGKRLSDLPRVPFGRKIT